MNSLRDFIDAIPKIEKKNYWFVRTMAGRLYRPFFMQSVVSLDYSAIPDDKITELITGDITTSKIDYIKEVYVKHKRPGLIISTLRRFYNEMKVGDVIIIPDISGKNIAVGEIISNVVKTAGLTLVGKDGRVYQNTKYSRVRKIKWLVESRRIHFSPYLFQLLNSHLTISNANHYAEWIDGLSYDLYLKDDKYHFILNFRQQHGLYARSVYGFFDQLFELTDDYFSDQKIEVNLNEVETKISLNSPGTVELIAIGGECIAILCILTVFINGGGWKHKSKDGTETELATKGFLNQLNIFLNSRGDRITKKMLTQKLRSMELQSSVEILSLFETINKVNQNESSSKD